MTTEERSQLDAVVATERMAAHKRRHARMLLKLGQGPHGPGWTNAEVAEAFDCAPRAAEQLRVCLTERGFQTVLEHGNRGRLRGPKLDGVAEAHLIALACGAAPQGRNRWSARLLADQIVALDIVDSCSKSTVRRVLKRTNLSLT